MMWRAVPLCLLWCFWREQNAWCFEGDELSEGIGIAVPLCLFWCLWCEQNSQCFEGDELSAVKLKYIFLKTPYEWASLTSSFSVDVFLDFFGILSFQQFLFFCSTFVLSVLFIFELPFVYWPCAWVCFLAFNEIIYFSQKRKRKRKLLAYNKK